MKNNHSHIKTAVKALNRQLEKYRNDRDRFEVAENSARESKEFFEKEIQRLKTQVQELEGALPVDKTEFSLT